MHIETRLKQVFFLTTLLLLPFSAMCQDTVNIKPFERYWTRPRIVPKVGFGVQDAAFAEAGIQLHRIFVHPLTLASQGPYITFEGVILENDFILGSKLGYELTAGLLGLAADLTYYTDFDRESMVATPKIGLSILGFADLLYGYNFVLSDDSFKSISNNRFSLTFNINKDYFNLRAAPKKRGK